MKAAIEIITPAFAKQLLENNVSNRPISETLVVRYARDMKLGLWQNNGQGIAISPAGKLMDGQHRMRAVILSQKEVAMVVVRGVPEETFVTMDTGRSRTMSDVLHIEGHTNSAIAASVARLGYNYAANASLLYSPSRQELSGFVAKHPYVFEAADLVSGRNFRFPKVALATVLFLGNYNRKFDEEVQQFIDGVLSGEGMFKGDARLTLREWIMARRQVRAGQGRVTTSELFGATVRAWNAYAAGKELALIKMIDKPTRTSLPIFGFDSADFPDVPDIAARTAAVRLANVTGPNSAKARFMSDAQRQALSL